MKYKSDGNPSNNCGSSWNKIGRKEDFMLMKITVNEPGNHTFVLFRNKNKGDSEEEFYDKQPAWFIFPYKDKKKLKSGNREEGNLRNE